MAADPRRQFPIVRRGYDAGRVDAYLRVLTAELDRLAAENRALHRRPGDAELARLAAERDAARADIDRLAAERDAARVDIDRLAAERRRAVAEAEAARAEVDRLVRARVEVHRELAALGEALRRWLARGGAGDGGRFRPPPSTALAPKAGPDRLRDRG